ncbi:CG0192-related protein [Catenuloplanes japonicus]|uniref:CG0192-related protein n=1 Tax=Catenuloplanes japonicus TaxID=33876 RepID=UPI00068BF05B|nr:hypothetical protein [Catenuloplanes japonicus]
MAILHKAQLVPSKLDLLKAWLPSRAWFDGEAAGDSGAGIERVAAFRFDDPAGRVGVETVLVTQGRDVYHVPLTYRGAPLAGAEAHLVGTCEHSVLGKRWIYDAAADPVYATALAHAVLTGGTNADEIFAEDRRSRTPDCRAKGTGTASQAPAVNTRPSVKDGDPTVITSGGLTLTIVRVVDTAGVVPAWAEGRERLEAETGAHRFTLATAYI